MINGTYGTNKPANITYKDVDIFYYYRPTRSEESNDFPYFKRLDSNLLETVNGENNGGNISVLPGMYNLRLPIDKFGEVGVYTIYIKPREIYGKIFDVSVLSANPDIKGVVFDSSDFDGLETSDGDLVGYRIDYFDDDGNRMDYYRIITSNNKCEPVAQNFNDMTQKGIRYSFNMNSGLIFCTVSPSTEMSFKSNSAPFIGKPMQKVALINTKFNPICLEVEITEHDIETISTMLEGNQIRNLDEGLITTFDKNGGIYHQASYGNIINGATGLHHDFKLNKTDAVSYTEEDKLNEIVDNV